MDGYRIVRTLGRGVFSTTYEASRDGHTVALKVLKKQHEQDAWVLAGFRREGLIGAKVRHPNLVRIRESRLHQPPYYHVCDVAAGHSLRGAALLPTNIVVDVIAQIGDALGHLHRGGFVHGDVKPGNILLAKDGHATLIDLGFARKPGSVDFRDGLPGTAHYLAPELCRTDYRDTPAADVFALGVTAYELLTGELPYAKLDETEAVLRQHRNVPPRTSALPWVNEMLRMDLFARTKLTAYRRAAA